jgi:hypothetical protein
MNDIFMVNIVNKYKNTKNKNTKNKTKQKLWQIQNKAF